MSTQSHETHLSAAARPVEVPCTPAQTDDTERETNERPSRNGAREAGEPTPAPRTIRPPGARLDDVMGAFREQRRLEQAEGPCAGVIETVLARRGTGSLAADLALER